ncbi:MAG: hypothetical protein CMJ49_09530, partial [Planctomycetaceae bacterium]|nr:hypothetical protein [Planctomycetaceae bacterium]
MNKVTRQSARFWLICLVTFTTASAVRADAPADNTPPDAFRSFAERVAAVPQRLPIIVTAAEAAAAQKAAHPDTLID